MSFQRARSREQIAQRKSDLMDAAASLMAEHGYEEVSLNAISNLAGITKASTYRYFESKEDIYLRLLMRDIAEWTTQLEKELAQVAEQSETRIVAVVLIDSTIKRPRYWNLLAVMSSILERNISLNAMAGYKTELKDYWVRITNAIKVAVPELTVERIQVFIQQYVFLVASGWHTAHPSAVISQLYEMSDFIMWKRDFRKDLIDSLYYTLQGMLKEKESPFEL